jgi:hypothetical protein
MAVCGAGGSITKTGKFSGMLPHFMDAFAEHVLAFLAANANPNCDNFDPNGLILFFFQATDFIRTLPQKNKPMGAPFHMAA